MYSTADTNQMIGSRRFVRLGAAALAAAGVLFFLYPAVRPWHDESTVGGAVASMSSNAWVAAHLFAMLALILVPLGLLGLCRLAEESRGFGLTMSGTVAIWFGAGLALPYYGAEDFALHAVASKVNTGVTLDLLSLVDAIRFGTAAATTFGLGLILLGVGGVLLAVSVWRANILPRLSGVALAITLLLFIPQFYLPAWARIAHGILVALALLWLAAALWTAVSHKDASSDRFTKTNSVSASV